MTVRLVDLLVLFYTSTAVSLGDGAPHRGTVAGVVCALQSARAATCLVDPFPGPSFQGYERESGTRHRRFMSSVATASRLKGLRAAATGGGWPGRSSIGTPGRTTPDRPGAAP